MTRHLLRALFALVLLVALAAPAKADSVDLNLANIAVVGPFGTITYTLSGSSINVIVLMNPGFTIKGGDGNDFGFNVVGSTTGVTVSNIMRCTVSNCGTAASPLNFSATTADFNTSQNIDGFGTFEFALAKIGGNGSQPDLVGFSFTVSRDGGFSSASQLFELSTGGGSGSGHFVIHLVCSTCGSTGFAVDAGGTPIPEPGTMALFGTGLLGLAGVIRRRMNL